MPKQSISNHYKMIPEFGDNVIWTDIYSMVMPFCEANFNTEKGNVLHHSSEYFGETVVECNLVHFWEPIFEKYRTQYLLHSYFQVWNVEANSTIGNTAINPPCMLIAYYRDFESNSRFLCVFIHDQFRDRSDEGHIDHLTIMGGDKETEAFYGELPKEIFTHANLLADVENMVTESDVMLKKIQQNTWADYTLHDYHEELVAVNN